MKHRKCALLLASMIFMIVPAGSPLLAATSDWKDLHHVKPDRLIRVQLRDNRTYDGMFQAVNDEGITLRRASGEQTFGRNDVLKIYAKGKNNRLRNPIIGGTIGVAFFAIPTTLANSRNGWWKSAAWVWFTSVPLFSAVGAAMPTGRWSEFYCTPEHQR